MTTTRKPETFEQRFSAQVESVANAIVAYTKVKPDIRIIIVPFAWHNYRIGRTAFKYIRAIQTAVKKHYPDAVDRRVFFEDSPQLLFDTDGRRRDLTRYRCEGALVWLVGCEHSSRSSDIANLYRYAEQIAYNNDARVVDISVVFGTTDEFATLGAGDK